MYRLETLPVTRMVLRYNPNSPSPRAPLPAKLDGWFSENLRPPGEA
jgi:hypothetical protein